MAKEPLEVFSVESILEDFESLSDPRSTVNRHHLLGDIVVISILAVIAGADGPRGIGLWAESNKQWLQDKLPLPYGIPSHDTIGRVLMAIRPEAFQECFQTWIQRLIVSADDKSFPVISIDGKALRRSHDESAGLGPLFLVSAWSSKQGLSLGQLATEAKSNEITAIPKLIEQIDIKGAVVTIDAAGCQKSIAEKIVAGGGDYVLALKGNQGKLHQAVSDYLTKHLEDEFRGLNARKHIENRKGHGRREEITYYQVELPEGLPGQSDWQGLETVGIVVSYREQKDKWSTEVRYYLSSLKLDAKTFATCVRGHWGIENSLHWCLDVTFREDETRTRNRILADNLAWLRRFAISLLKQVDDKESIAMRRRKAGWNPDYLSKVLGLATS